VKLALATILIQKKFKNEDNVKQVTLPSPTSDIETSLASKESP